MCPSWHTAAATDSDCGRLPWIFNVAAAYYESEFLFVISYHTLTRMGNVEGISVRHLFYKYGQKEQPTQEVVPEKSNRDEVALIKGKVKGKGKGKYGWVIV